MDSSALTQIIGTLVDLDPSASLALDAICEPLSYKKGDFLFKAGKIPHHAAFMVSGVARAFYLNNKGSEYNKTFFLKNSFPMPLTALITKKPNKINCQALTDCEVILFDFSEFKSLFQTYPLLKDFYIKAIEGEWIKKEQHDIAMVTNDATTNYNIFLETFPGLDQLIPQYHIASYLGITPIQLSRIRASLFK
ncbi:Crp/Fnr family transcriptional regulator [Muricauda sp. 334s03]|uniref:Crp/Fnr family transcriptional regulator n=1 Tax=Flagellimonas yonaguniensis TaxID=3031325 RepID=A0ABT5Y073_9FLAO|nr:Crp/Fnr family transcriptional regulator [[Muricauda] yonaguniensis]MDF0716835.1 Crp/Fnr family transcriptional regulator [[Muricauda] yonaguniensis]